MFNLIAQQRCTCEIEPYLRLSLPMWLGLCVGAFCPGMTYRLVAKDTKGAATNLAAEEQTGLAKGYVT